MFEFDVMTDVFRSGADGYIIKEIECESFIESLKLVALGEKILPSQLVKHLPLRSAMSNVPPSNQSELLNSLSEREVETLRCLIMGYPNKVIAYRLEISEATVKVHVKAILRKLMVQNRTQAAIWAVNHGLDANAACATLAVSSDQSRSEDEPKEINAAIKELEAKREETRKQAKAQANAESSACGVGGKASKAESHLNRISTL